MYLLKVSISIYEKFESMNTVNLNNLRLLMLSLYSNANQQNPNSEIKQRNPDRMLVYLYCIQGQKYREIGRIRSVVRD